MNIRSRKALHRHTQNMLSKASDNHRMIALVYGGINFVLALSTTILSDFLRIQIAETGGLSNLGMRSILSTVQYILPFVQLIIMFSLDLGLCRAAMNLSRGRHAEPRTLTEGLSRFGPMIRAVLLQGIILMGVCIGAVYLSSYIFLMLPISADFVEAAMPLMESMSMLNTEYVMDEATALMLTETMIPMLWIFGVVFAIVAIPLLYKYRLVNYWLLDMAHPNALGAMKLSTMAMRRNRFAFFRLDLDFWWYYLLHVLVTVIAYGDVRLTLAGVTLPWSATFSYYLFYAVSLLLQTLVYYFFLNRVQITYAAAFDVLKLQLQPASPPAAES